MTGRRRSKVGAFAMLPVDVLTSPAVRTLPHVAHRVLVALAAQYTGANNGSLSLTRKSARAFGLSDHHTLYAALRELEVRGLSVQTRPGTRLPPRSALFAITWRGIDEPLSHDWHDVRPNPIPGHGYSKWNPERGEPHWTTERRATRWRAAPQRGAHGPLVEADMRGAWPLKDPSARGAHDTTSHISPPAARSRRRGAA
jgi:hypothetical protein